MPKFTLKLDNVSGAHLVTGGCPLNVDGYSEIMKSNTQLIELEFLPTRSESFMMETVWEFLRRLRYGGSSNVARKTLEVLIRDIIDKYSMEWITPIEEVPSLQIFLK